MLIIVTYDVSTETAAGRKRLRRVAKAWAASNLKCNTLPSGKVP
jgi:CRISPR/Cas system-associated endoribonuclease Cas2